MPRTEKLKIKTSLVNVAIIGTLVVITVAVGPYVTSKQATLHSSQLSP